VAKKNLEQLFQSVRHALFWEWDPIGVNQWSSAVDEYDSYARTIAHYLEEGTDEHKLSDYLSKVVRTSIGLSNVNEAHNHDIACRLLALSMSDPKR
jgi:hypothetical protein